IADASAGLQDALAKREMQVGRLLEEDVAHRLPRSVVRAGLGLRDVRVALNDVAAFLLRLLGGTGGGEQNGERQRESAFHPDSCAGLKGARSVVRSATLSGSRLHTSVGANILHPNRFGPIRIKTIQAITPRHEAETRARRAVAERAADRSAPE